MSFVLDSYYPFDSGSGAVATQSNWRAMARLWSASGIIPGNGNQLRPTFAGSILSIDIGAVWIDGFYGENHGPKTFTVGTTTGMLVARADPTNRDVILIWVPAQTAPTQNPSGIYEIPIARMASGTMVDIRQFASAGYVPSGVMWDFGGAAAPAGWLLCDGSSKVVTDYQPLFNAIGYVFGGSGANFSVPDCRSRVIVGAGTGTGLSARALASKAGEENHILVVGEVAAHNHTVSIADPGHGHSGASVAGFAPGTIGFAYTGSTEGLQAGSTGTRASFTSGVGIGAAASRVTATSANTGSGTGHNNMQPYIAVTKIIKI